MNGIGDDDGKIGTSQLMPDQDLLTIFSNMFCFHGCLNQNKTRFRSEPFKRELKKLFPKEKDFNIRCSGSLNESMYVPKYTEEMKIKSPDLDVMFIADTMCISDESSDDIPAEKTCVGTLVSTDLPAYFRISVCSDQRSFYSDELIFKNTKFVSSKQLLESVAKGLLSHALPNEKYIITGPSVMVPPDNYQDTSIPYESIDQVFALRCFSSRIVKYWLSRERKSNKWPPRYIIESVITKGCLLVPKGHPLSHEFDLLWRVSFSEVEVLLSKALTRQKRQCYLVAKYLIKGLDKCVISSYHIKTVFFWLLENDEFPSDMSLGEGVLQIIKELSKSLSSHSIPNYFIEGNNLLEHIPIDECLLLADELKLALSQPVLSFINSPQIKLVLKPMDLAGGEYTYDKVASAVRTYNSTKNKINLALVLRHLHFHLWTIGSVCLGQMDMYKMGLDLFRCLADVNIYLETPCKLTDLLVDEVKYGFKSSNVDRIVSAFIALRLLIGDEELQCKYIDIFNDDLSSFYCNAACKYHAYTAACEEVYYDCQFCEGECKCSEYSARCKYHTSICACDVKGDFDIEESIAETERLFEHSISLEPDQVASRVEYALFLQCEERFEEAVRMAKSAFDIAVKKNDFKSGHYFGIGEESRVDGNMGRLIGYLKFLQIPSVVLSYYIYTTCLCELGKREVNEKEFVLFENASYKAKGIERDHSLLMLGHTCLLLNEKSSAKKHFQQIQVTKENKDLIEENILICNGGEPEIAEFTWNFADRFQIDFKPFESEGGNKEANR